MSIKDLLDWHRLQDKGDPNATAESDSEDKQHGGTRNDHLFHGLKARFSRRRFIRTAAGAAGATGIALGSGLSIPALADHDDDEDEDHRREDRDGDADDKASPSPIPGGTPLLAPLSPEIFHLFFPPAAGVEPSTITDFRGFIGLATVGGTGTGIDTNTGQRTQLFFDGDVRFFQGKYIGMCDREEHTGTFGFI